MLDVHNICTEKTHLTLQLVLADRCGAYFCSGSQRQSFMAGASGASRPLWAAVPEPGVLSPAEVLLSCLFAFLPAPGLVAGAAGLALQDRRGLGGVGGFMLESGWSSHSQYNRVPCKCEVTVTLDRIRCYCLPFAS